MNSYNLSNDEIAAKHILTKWLRPKYYKGIETWLQVSDSPTIKSLIKLAAAIDSYQPTIIPTQENAFGLTRPLNYKNEAIDAAQRNFETGKYPPGMHTRKRHPDDKKFRTQKQVTNQYVLEQKTIAVQPFSKLLTPTITQKLEPWLSLQASPAQQAALTKILDKLLQIEEWLPTYGKDACQASGPACNRLHYGATLTHTLPCRIREQGYYAHHPPVPQVTQEELEEMAKIKEDARIMSRRHWHDQVKEQRPKIPRTFATTYNDSYKPPPENYGIIPIGPNTTEILG
eukprot:Platyproteum_vivax@DN1247_c0_g1_i1.p1